MPIDIDALTESELIDLNHRIVARLRFVSIVTDDGQRWNVAPHFLECAAPCATGKPGGSNAISIQRNDQTFP
jgi:hypothetical protein